MKYWKIIDNIDIMILIAQYSEIIRLLYLSYSIDWRLYSFNWLQDDFCLVDTFVAIQN